MKVWVIASVTLLVPRIAIGQPATLRIPRVSPAPSIHDFLTNTPREGEAVVSDFRQREPGDGTPASQATSVHLSYDDTNLYVVFVCKDSEPDKLRARLDRREAILSDDAVYLGLDTFHDRQRAYEFFANPLGVQLDAIHTEGRGEDFSFDTLWRSVGQVLSDGYVVLMAIPFKSLRFPETPAQEWGFSLGRLLPRNSEVSFWPYITRRVEGFAQQFATLEGLSQVSPGRNLQFIPYGTFTGARFLDRGDISRFATKWDSRFGTDAKIVLKDAFTLDIALNPDFSQVETDEPQVTVNQRFEVFFPERRPFFIENAGFFQTQQNLFFSRRIGDPQVGARLTGKIGHWTIGGLAIDDRAPGKQLAVDAAHYETRAAMGVGRVQREFGTQSNVGIMVTFRDFAGSTNRVASLDTRLKLNEQWVFAGQVMTSDTRQPDGTHQSAPGYFGILSRSGRKFFYNLAYLDVSPEFRAELGFIPRTDIRELTQFFGLRWHPAGRFIQAIGPNSFVNLNWDREGRLQDWSVRFPFEISMKGRTSLFVERMENFELFQGYNFRQHANFVRFGSEWLGWLGGFVTLRTGNRPNFEPAPGGTPFLAESFDASTTLTLRPTSRLRLDETYLYGQLRLPNQHVFDNHIVRSKINYQFTPQWSVRAILDYNAVLPNPTLISLDRRKRLTADLLLTYLVNPGTAFYLGYTDGYENLVLASPMEHARAPTISTGRQLFVKTSYLWRF